MSEINKVFALDLDMKREDTYRPFTLLEGDTGNILVLSLYDDGVAVSLSACLIVAVFSNSNGTAEQDNRSADGGVTVGSGDSSNVVTIDLKTGAFASGLNECEIQVYSGSDSDTLVTSSRFNFDCIPPILNSDTIAATDSYPLLVELISEVAALADREQADWSESDTTSGKYIQNKPTEMDPTEHASTHALNGADAVTPSAIGAAEITHASQHSSSGEDPVTPESIGAASNVHAASHAPNGTDAITGYELARLQFTDTAVATTAFVADTTYTDFPYRAAIAMTGVIAAMTPEIVFSATDALSGTFAPVAACYAGGVYIYASEVPSSAITIPTIICWKAVG